MNYKSIDFNILIKSLVLLIKICNGVYGHGRLVDPPSRSSAWRYGFKTERNYNDQELFCGGFTTQWRANRGKCGVCGDPFNGPKDNELPNGKYAKNLVISRTYREGSAIKAKVELTANHNGFFLFKLCPTKTDKKEVTQKCLDRFPLEVLNSVVSDKYVVLSKRAQMFTIELKLPKGLTCQRCVFQWTYICANNWGKCDNGSSAVGCGPQETFRGCADVKIVGQNEEIKDITTTTPELSTNLENQEDQDRLNFIEDESIDSINHSNPETTSTETELKKSCGSTGIWRRVANMDEWCKVNCQANFCPPTHCSCF